jgi:hypothetical protein
MNGQNTRFLDAVVTTWEKVSVTAFQSTTKRSEDDSKLTIDIQTPQFTATIAAWEWAYCLDITLFQRATGSGAELSAGECTSLEEMQERITLLCELLTTK